MVDDIHFPKGLPPVSASGKIKRVNRKKRDDEKPPFEKYLNAEDKEKKKKKRKKKKSDTIDVSGKTEKGQRPSSADASNPDESAEAADDSEQKIIDVRV
ncbi:MAG: hypothetical protein PVI18_12355 [Desulfobacterales bacterium]|jgi:hypothetical protein